MTPADLDILACKLAERIVTPRWLRMSQAVQYAGVGKTEMLKLLRSGDISGYQRNDRGDWIVDKESIDTYHMVNMQDRKKFVAELLEGMI
jgi:hypothetical protein